MSDEKTAAKPEAKPEAKNLLQKMEVKVMKPKTAGELAAILLVVVIFGLFLGGEGIRAFLTAIGSGVANFGVNFRMGKNELFQLVAIIIIVVALLRIKY